MWLDSSGAKVKKSGDTMTGDLFMGGNSLQTTAEIRNQNKAWLRFDSNIGLTDATVIHQSTGILFPIQSTTAAAPVYVKGGMYFDTTLNRNRMGGATIWNDVVMIGDNVLALTPGATVALDVTTGADVFTLAPTGNETINVATVKKGQTISIIFTSRAVADVITFGTNFKSTGTLTMAGVAGKVHTMMFVSDGTNYNEISRTAGM